MIFQLNAAYSRFIPLTIGGSSQMLKLHVDLLKKC